VDDGGKPNAIAVCKESGLKAGEHCIKEQFEIGDGMEFNLRLYHIYNALAIGATSQFKGYSIHQRLT
jgi:hypothetical protein